MRVRRRLARWGGAAATLAVTALAIGGPLFNAAPPARAAFDDPRVAADPARPVEAAPPDFDIPNGHYYSQAGGSTDGERGFIVSNEAAIPFWDTYRALGGVDELGYPVSTRFIWRNATVQVMQRNVLVWNEADQKVTLANTFDLLHEAGHDKWLLDQKKVPPPFTTSGEANRDFQEVVANHNALLNVDDDIRERYFANSAPLDHYGLPMSYRDFPDVFVVRTQRAVFQKWKVETPFAKPGEVTIANGGDLAKEAGLFPKPVLEAVPSPFERAEATVTPWSGWWWPAHPAGGEPQLWQPGGPYAKFDRYADSLGRATDVAGWEAANMRFTKPDEDWAGHCNGWAAAAILEPEPTEPVTKNGITFSVGDQKGLLSGYHFGDEAIWVVGGGTTGTTPAELRDALQLWLGAKHKPFLANLYSKSTQVWSAPAYKYETLYGPDATKPNVNHFRTKVWYADYHVGPNFVGTQVFGGDAKVYEYYLEGPVNKPTGGGWEGISATATDFAHPFHLWYPDPTARNTNRWTPGLNYDLIKQIVPGAGTAPAAFQQTADLLGLDRTGPPNTPLLPNSFWLPATE